MTENMCAFANFEECELLSIICRKLDEEILHYLCKGIISNVDRLYDMRIFYEKKISEINSVKPI